MQTDMIIGTVCAGSVKCCVVATCGSDVVGIDAHLMCIEKSDAWRSLVVGHMWLRCNMGSLPGQTCFFSLYIHPHLHEPVVVTLTREAQLQKTIVKES